MSTTHAGTAALGLTAAPSLLLDAQGHVRHANAAARALLRAWGGLCLSGDGLVAGRRTEGRLLRHMLALAAAGVDGFFAMRGADDTPPVRVTVFALPDGDVLLRLHAPPHRAGPPEIFMRRSFALTPGEAERAVRIVEGASLEEVAERMDTIGD